MQVSLSPGARLAARRLPSPPPPPRPPRTALPPCPCPSPPFPAAGPLSDPVFLFAFRGHMRAEETGRRPGKGRAGVGGWHPGPGSVRWPHAAPGALGASPGPSPALLGGFRSAAVPGRPRCALIPRPVAHAAEAGPCRCEQPPPPSPGRWRCRCGAGGHEPSQEPGCRLPVAVCDNGIPCCCHSTGHLLRGAGGRCCISSRAHPDSLSAAPMLGAECCSVKPRLLQPK